jgi:hypothetical protein
MSKETRVVHSSITAWHTSPNQLGAAEPTAISWDAMGSAALCDCSASGKIAASSVWNDYDANTMKVGGKNMCLFAKIGW